MQLFLLFLEDLPDASLPKIPPDRSRVRFSAHGDPDHRPCFPRQGSEVAASCGPQIKKLPASELSCFDEALEGCLPPDPLIRTEPVHGLQRLDLGQLFPAFFATPRKDFSSTLGARAGKKPVLVPAFSFGRLICSFNHRAGL